MAMGIVSQQEIEAELNRLNTSKVNVVPINRGRGNTNEVPESLRKVIAEEAINGTKPEELAEVFGVSKQSVHAYKHGNTSLKTYHKQDKELGNHIENVKSSIATSARDKILTALKAISPEKLEAAKIRDASAVARDMSIVMEKMEGSSTDKTQVNQVFIYAPRQRDEDSYEVIDVSATA